MKPHLLKVPTNPSHSFSVRQDRIPNVNNSWHYHPEVELIRFHKGSGTQFVGDHIKRFEPGDVVLVGSNLPHYWRYDDGCFREGQQESPFATVVHFTENFWGDRFLNLPENKPLKTVLEKARRGILLRGDLRARVMDLMEKLHQAEGPYRILGLVECLMAVATARPEQVVVLSSLGFQYNFPESENERINIIYDYTFRHFRQKIALEEIASVAGLVPNSFCRYFKSRTGKTYSQFLQEIRVGYACKLLIDNNLSIKQLCYESGFNSFTCFHKYFKAITGKSPQNYQKAYAEKPV
ncbi:AraC family transcriptional regulator [Larkinella soli]|uniref:AraC family transcriptional regulator n=1 Tax=Larkinella soli TaxID=1770527 RepID=UPI000FFCC42C|nr:helix-turn-helix domain-containing protein [Larkinella soli]